MSWFKPKQTTKVWCECGNELISSHSFVEDNDKGVYYACAQCGRKSRWDFDSFPAPIYVGEWKIINKK